MRILVTGLGTFWGSHLAQQLEALPEVEMIVGLDTQEPRLPLERTEFMKADSNYSILDRIVRATQVDTILHTHLIVDSTELPGRALHEINVIGTMSLLAAAGASGSPVRKVVLKSSGLVYGAAKVPFQMFAVEGGTHFDIVRPISTLLVEKLKADTGEVCNVTLTQVEVNKAFADNRPRP